MIILSSICFAQNQKAAEALSKAARVFETPESSAKCSAVFAVYSKKLMDVTKLDRTNPKTNSYYDEKIKEANAAMELSGIIGISLFIQPNKITEEGMNKLIATNYMNYFSRSLLEIIGPYNECVNKMKEISNG